MREEPAKEQREETKEEKHQQKLHILKNSKIIK